MRCHYSGTSPKAKKCQFYLLPEPLWAWVCSVLDPQDSIKELMNCVLCTILACKNLSSACAISLRWVLLSMLGPDPLGAGLHFGCLIPPVHVP